MITGLSQKGKGLNGKARLGLPWPAGVARCSIAADESQAPTTPEGRRDRRHRKMQAGIGGLISTFVVL